MFQFPGFAPYGLCIHPQVTPSGCPVTPGFPIRRSPDQSLFDSSPRHIAAYHVLHRFLTPRHPPCTLNSLTTFIRGCRPQCRMLNAELGMWRHDFACFRLPHSPFRILCQAHFQRLRFIRDASQPRPLRAPTPRRVRIEPVVLLTTLPWPAGRSRSIPRKSGIGDFRRTCVRFFNCQRARRFQPCRPR